MKNSWGEKIDATENWKEREKKINKYDITDNNTKALIWAFIAKSIHKLQLFISELQKDLCLLCVCALR